MSGDIFTHFQLHWNKTRFNSEKQGRKRNRFFLWFCKTKFCVITNYKIIDCLHIYIKIAQLIQSVFISVILINTFDDADYIIMSWFFTDNKLIRNLWYQSLIFCFSGCENYWSAWNLVFWSTVCWQQRFYNMAKTEQKGNVCNKFLKWALKNKVPWTIKLGGLTFCAVINQSTWSI